MEHIIATLLRDFEHGHLTRRELIPGRVGNWRGNPQAAPFLRMHRLENPAKKWNSTLWPKISGARPRPERRTLETVRRW
jgi:hypothetical protein